MQNARWVKPGSDYSDLRLHSVPMLGPDYLLQTSTVESLPAQAPLSGQLHCLDRK